MFHRPPWSFIALSRALSRKREREHGAGSATARRATRPLFRSAAPPLFRSAALALYPSLNRSELASVRNSSGASLPLSTRPWASTAASRPCATMARTRS